MLKEEKIRSSVNYFDNHLNQLRSYIFEIHNYEISYGYLLYWRYSFQNDEETNVSVDDFSLRFEDNEIDDSIDNSDINKGGRMVIEQAFATKIESTNEDHKAIYEKSYKNVQKLVKNGRNFDEVFRNPSKCGGCVVSTLCGHKTGKFDSFSFPYDEKFLKQTMLNIHLKRFIMLSFN